jgi:hypothetical protein
MFKDCASILDAIWHAFLTKLGTTALFPSAQVDFGQPPLSSFSTSSLLPQNREYHQKIFDQFRA